MRFFRPWGFLKWFIPKAISRITLSEKILCLTFDDGPDPASTLSLLKILGKYNIPAVFFCNGSASEKYPGIITLIKEGGHIIGNHGFLHIDGWRTSCKKYLADIACAARTTSDVLFRPPFGRLRPCQYINLLKTYKIVMWDIMPYDFDNGFGSRNSLRILKRHIRAGSVIALHDSTHSTVHEFIEEFIVFALSEGYRFDISGILNYRPD